jgi:hypothetical protein
MQVNRVGAWLEVGGVYPQSGEHFQPDTNAEFSILSAFGFVSGLPVVVNADKKGSSQKVNSLLTGCFAMTGGPGGCLRLAGCGGQTIAQSSYICLDGIEAFGQCLEGEAEFRGGEMGLFQTKLVVARASPFRLGNSNPATIAGRPFPPAPTVRRSIPIPAGLFF